MAKTEFIKINDLNLDLKNYRTVPQKNEVDAISAMISIKPDRFFAIIDSIIDDGYLLTENLIVLENGKYIVKEGNRRTAALKLIHGIHDIEQFNIPDSIKNKINSLAKNWKNENIEVPCTIFPLSDSSKADKIINLAHAKGEKASRDPWTSVARARHNRDEKKASEPTLDILEKYLLNGKNLTAQQKDRWSGDYNLTVLDEALRKIIKRFDCETVAELSQKYPKINYKDALEDIIRDIGLELFGFKEIRDKYSDFAESYGLPPESQSDEDNEQDTSNSNTSTTSATSSSNANSSTGTNTSSNQGQSNQSNSTSSKPPKAHSLTDQRGITATLKKFNPRGSDRQKVVALRDELRKLKVKDNPIAFCFILRSMFEISAKIYSNENSLPTTKTKNGKSQDKTLVELLSNITNNLTANKSNKAMVKVLHGANTEISKSTGLLSVTSLNQLVHNPSFSIAPNDICILFNNIYPLLEAMN